MASGDRLANAQKLRISKRYAYLIAASAALFTFWIAFFLPAPPVSKILLICAFSGLEAFLLILLQSGIDSALESNKSKMDDTVQEIKDCQKMLVNDEKTAAITKFSSVVSHELKNPLSSLKNIAYYLIKTVQNEDQKGKRMMEMLSSEVDRVDRMIVDFSNISHAKRINKMVVSVSEMMENALRECSIPQEITLETHIEQGIEANIDPERIAVVLKNLVKNAVQASGEKGIVRVGLKRAANFIEIYVDDDGSGIDSTSLGNIFEPMYTTKTKSLGLGLTVVKLTTEAHDGRVEVSSETGKGSSFRVFLPF